MINSFDLLFSIYKSYTKYNNNGEQKLMIKTILKQMLLFIISLFFLVACSTESILEELTGSEIFWLCYDSNVAYDDADQCNTLCSATCISYDSNEIPLTWTYYCNDLEEYYDSMQDCHSECPNNCIVVTDS